MTAIPLEVLADLAEAAPIFPYTDEQAARLLAAITRTKSK